MSQAKVERSVTVNNDMSWHLHFAGRLVEISANNVLKELPLHINKLKDLQDIVHCVERAHVYPGIHRQILLKLCRREVEQQQEIMAEQ